MDPNANLQEQMRLAARIIEAFDHDRGVNDHDAARLAELVVSLRNWIANGGFPPDWRRS